MWRLRSGCGPRLGAAPSMARGYATGQPVVRKRMLVAVGVTATCGAIYLSNETVRDSVKFALHAAQRTSSVLDAASRCVWKYYWVLNGKYEVYDDFEAAINQCHKQCADITLKAIERNKGLFIKLGQHISALTHVFPPEWTETMMPLQDQCPVSSYESINNMFIEDEGAPINEVFASFEPKPLGTASLAQVHRATLKDGSEVAVKVQHPSLKTFIPLDVMLIGQIFAMIDFWFPQYPLSWLSDEMQNSIYTELDFREEAKNATLCGEVFAPMYRWTALRVPKVYWSKKRILCMEFLTGGRPDNLEFLMKNNINTADLSYCFAQIFNTMIFTPGVGLHCDPHAGNIAIKPLTKEEQLRLGSDFNFEIILYDHGLYRYVPTESRRAYAHLWLALLANDQDKMRHYAKKFAHVDDKGFEIFVAAITGRDIEYAQGRSVMSTRSDDERDSMMRKVQEQGLVGPIMRMLHNMPNVVLLILKTNDLIRYLDEKLNSPLGIVKSFLIMARYCANTVYYEGVDEIRAKYGHGFSFCKSWALTLNWSSYVYARMKILLLDTFSWMVPTDGSLGI